jgi:hypothetical protein
VVAWGQLHSGDDEGSAIADHLITFAQETQWHQPLLTYAREYHRQVISDYDAFCKAVELEIN